MATFKAQVTPGRLVRKPSASVIRGPGAGEIKFSVRSFFDAKDVIAATSAAERKVLTTIGSRIRLTARRSIRNRKRVSRPGQPPTNKTGLLRNFIKFWFDFATRSVIIGPEKLPKPGQVPNVLEEGGRTTIRLRANRKQRKKKSRRRDEKRVTIKARPYMGPAFNKEVVNLPELWRNSIK